MKILILMLLISCSKSKLQEIRKGSGPELNAAQTVRDWSDYSPVIDVMVAFLWPEKISTESDRVKLENVIEISRELKTRKEQFQNEKMFLKNEYDAHSCACVLNGECNGTEDNLNEMKCYEIEEKTYANDRKLIDIFGLVEAIKENVLAIGGEWLATHMDLREIPSSKMNFEKMGISFSAFGSYQDNGTTRPVSYNIESAPVYRRPYFERLKVSFSRVQPAQGTWTIDVGISQSKASILFQGDLYLDDNGLRRRGIIYWENPHL